MQERQGSGRAGNRCHRALDTQITEHVLRAPAKGKSGTGFAQFAGGFVHFNRKAGAGERNRCSQAAKACSDHQHGIICSHGGKVAQIAARDNDSRLGMSGQLC